jgi:hypothetical protein
MDWVPGLLNQDDRPRIFSGRDLVLEIFTDALRFLQVEVCARSLPSANAIEGAAIKGSDAVTADRSNCRKFIALPPPIVATGL